MTKYYREIPHSLFNGNHFSSIYIKRLRLAMEMDEERKARLEKMVANAQPMLA